jgi:hypothetical protein
MDDQASQVSDTTSPPSSVAPNDDGDFTAALLQRAAKNLGVEYVPGLRSENPYRQYNWSQTLHLETRTVEELQQMIVVRSKALGPNHSSIAALQTTLADRFAAMDGAASKAENWYHAALATVESGLGTESPELIPTLTKLGNLYSTTGKWSLAKDCFKRCASICERKAGGTPTEHSAPSSVVTSARDLPPSKLHTLLKELGSQRSLNVESAQRAVGSHLLQTLQNSLQPPSKDMKEAKSSMEIEVQTDVTDQVEDSTIYLPPPPPSFTPQQAQRVRGPALRSASDLKSLVQYLAKGQSDTSHVHSNLSDFDSSVLVSPRSKAAELRTKELQRVLNQVRTTKGHEDYSPEDAAEREVARILLNNSVHRSF